MASNAVLLVTDDRKRSADIPPLLAGLLGCDVVDLDAGRLPGPKGHTAILFDVDLADHRTAQKLQTALAGLRRDKTPRIFLTGEISHHARVQAAAFGGSAVFHRPIRLPKLMLAISGPPPDPAPVVLTAEIEAAAKTAAGSLTNLFAALKKDVPIDFSDMNEKGEMIDAAVMQGEVSQWIAAVREHHSYTYRHCMLVAGVTAAFAQYLGIGPSCRRRLMRGALLHDIGKAYISVAILDKPDKLTAAERLIMRAHPRHGRKFLEKHHGAESELIEIVYRHHELLDGSGYPHGLKAAEISDPVRIITICDIYAALVEPRPYKKTCTQIEAFTIMEEMGDKLDRQLLKAFKPVALAGT